MVPLRVFSFGHTAVSPEQSVTYPEAWPYYLLYCRWYAICGATQSKSSQLPDCEGGLYRSEDSGATWQRIFDGGPVCNPAPLCSASIAPADALGTDSASPAEHCLCQPQALHETSL